MSWLPVANIHGVVEALASMEPRYTSHTKGLNLSKPAGGWAADAMKRCRLAQSGRVGVGDVAGQHVEVGPRRDDLVEHVGGVRGRRIVVGLVIAVVVDAGGNAGRQHRGVVGALVAHHGEPERAQRISRVGHRGRRRADVAGEAVVGAPAVEVRHLAGQVVEGNVRRRTARPRAHRRRWPGPG